MTVSAARRVPNQTLRAIRLALRLSQNEFAAAIRHAGESLGEPNTANKRLIQKWESGEHAECRPNYRRALEAVTRTQYEQLGFVGAPALPVNQVLPAPRTSQAAARRRALGDLSPSDAAGGPGDRLRFALERPGTADPDGITLAESATAHLFGLEHHQPARQLTASVTRHIDEIAVLLAGTRREPLRRRLATTGGQAAALAGWLAFDRGDSGGAHRYWDSSLAAARYSADGALLACTLTYLSYSSAERGDPATAWQLAHTAVAHAGVDPRSRSWMAARAAEEAALLGERRAALSELDLALGLGSDLRAPAPDEPTAAWSRFFDQASLAAMAATVHGRLGDARAAREAAGWALRALGPAQVKSRAVVLAEVACAAARVGDLDLAGDAGLRAGELTTRLEVTLARRKLRTLLQLLAAHRTAAPVRELIAQLEG